MPTRRHALRRRVRSVLFRPTTRADARHLSDILRQETVGGLLMLATAALALVWANFAPHSYHHVAAFRLGPLSVEGWTADGLLTVFFFVAGLELKREIAEGSLRRPVSALVPVVAAVCGMAVPAGLFVAINTALPGGHPHGWAIPMATDIAFALAVLAIVGSALPGNLRSFLLTLAIVDDLGSIIVIAIFFSHGLHWWWLAAAAGLLALWWGMHRLKLRGWWWFLPVGVAAWWCTLQSGVHATISGVALGLLVPTSAADEDDAVDRWEHRVRPLSAGVAVPLFALFAAGVEVAPSTVGRLFAHPVPLGVFAGLVLGKLAGVFLGAYVTARATGRTRLPQGVRWREVAGVATLAGIGFTVSLLMCHLAFAEQPDLLAEAKAAVLLASLTSALIGGGILMRRSLVRRRVATPPGGDDAQTQARPADAH